MPVDNLTDVILALTADSATGASSTYVFTTGAGYTDDGHGRLSATAGVDVAMVASFQPISGRMLRQLPEGSTSYDLLEGYVVPDAPTRALTPANEQTQTKGDTVLISGERFEVVRSHDWRAIAGYLHIVVQRVYT